jgi:isochorismatase family protein
MVSEYTNFPTACRMRWRLLTQPPAARPISAQATVRVTSRALPSSVLCCSADYARKRQNASRNYRNPYSPGGYPHTPGHRSPHFLEFRLGEFIQFRLQPGIDYFRQFKGLDAGDHFTTRTSGNCPSRSQKSIHVVPDNIVVYESDDYLPLRDFLKENRIRNVILTGYCTDMCVKGTTAGYANLRKDFNVFLVGDATPANFPAATSPACAITAAVCFASLDLLITQVSWVRGM